MCYGENDDIKITVNTVKMGTNRIQVHQQKSVVNDGYSSFSKLLSRRGPLLFNSSDRLLKFMTSVRRFRSNVLRGVVK